jgi:hypothetical protein
MIVGMQSVITNTRDWDTVDTLLQSFLTDVAGRCWGFADGAIVESDTLTALFAFYCGELDE